MTSESLPQDLAPSQVQSLVTLPTITANPVDVYINSLSSRRSQETMRTALRSVVRVMGAEAEGVHDSSRRQIA